MNDRVLEVEVSCCCSDDCARCRERKGLVGEFSRLARRSCLDMASESRGSCNSPGTQHLRAATVGVGMRVFDVRSITARTRPANGSADPLSGERWWINFIQN